MTKTVRIENACTSNFKVRVLVQDKIMVQDDDTGTWLWTGEWKTVNTKELPFPTRMLSDYITSSRRFIVEEYEESTTNA